jgi:hypothetical protein
MKSSARVAIAPEAFDCANFTGFFLSGARNGDVTDAP